MESSEKLITVEEWCQALESGEWKQGRFVLCSEHTDGSMAYCCLGVGAKLAEQPFLTGGTEYPRRFLSDLPSELWRTGNKSPDTVDIAIRETKAKGFSRDTVSGLNDSGEVTFSEIAAIVRATVAACREVE